MMNTKLISIVTTGAITACLALGACAGNKAATNNNSGSTQATSTVTTSSSKESKNATATSNSGKETTTSTTNTSTPAPAPAPAPAAPTASNGYVGEEAAKNTALADAGLPESDVTELKVELDLDDAVVHYDVDFKHGGMEYDYDIDANTGAILSHKAEVDD